MIEIEGLGALIFLICFGYLLYCGVYFVNRPNASRAPLGDEFRWRTFSTIEGSQTVVGVQLVAGERTRDRTELARIDTLLPEFDMEYSLAMNQCRLRARLLNSERERELEA